MMKGVWVWWPTRDKLGKYLGLFDTIFLDIYWGSPTTKEVKEYIKLCNKNNIKVIIDIPCFADPDNEQSLASMHTNIKFWGNKADGIVLDYIRYKDISDYAANNFNTKKIYDLLKFAKSNSNKLYLTNYSWPMCYLVGQNHKKFSKYGTVIPMLYGSKPYSKTRTFLLLSIYKTFFSYTEPILPAWDEGLKWVGKYKEYFKNYHLFRWITYLHRK